MAELLLGMARGQGAAAAVIFFLALAETGILLRVFLPRLIRKLKGKRGGAEEGPALPQGGEKPPWERLRGIEDALRADAGQRKARQAEVDKAMRNVTLQACIAVLYNANPDMPPLEQFNAAITYFKLRGNGNGQNRVAKIIMKTANGIEMWKSALNEDMKANGPCEDRYFQGVLEWIEKHTA